MRYLISLVLLSVVMIMACGGQKNPGPLYEPGTEEYSLFETLSDSMGIEVLDPDKNKALITTSEFTIWTSDIMPALYSPLSRMSSQIYQIPPNQIYQFIEENAKYRAQQRMIVTEAKSEGIVVADSSVQSQLEQYYEAHNGKDEFLKYIAQRNIPIDAIKEDIRANLYEQRYKDEVVASDFEITEEELYKEYEKPKTASVRHILFSTQNKSEPEKAEIKEKAQQVLEKARSGADFAKLARQYSDDTGSAEKGGLIEGFSRGQMVKPFEEVAFNTQVGEISDLVETRFGYHIIKVVDRQKEEKPFDEVKDSILSHLKSKYADEKQPKVIEKLKDEYNYQEKFTWSS